MAAADVPLKIDAAAADTSAFAAADTSAFAAACLLLQAGLADVLIPLCL